MREELPSCSCRHHWLCWHKEQQTLKTIECGMAWLPCDRTPTWKVSFRSQRVSTKEKVEKVNWIKNPWIQNQSPGSFHSVYRKTRVKLLLWWDFILCSLIKIPCFIHQVRSKISDPTALQLAGNLCNIQPKLIHSWFILTTPLTFFFFFFKYLFSHIAQHILGNIFLQSWFCKINKSTFLIFHLKRKCLSI